MQKGQAMHLIGRYYHALEQKGRLSIPAPLRENLAENVVITTGLDRCLFLFDTTGWEREIAAYRDLPYTDKSARNWIRLLTHNAHRTSFDKIGRIRLPQHLIDYAHLKKNTVIAGALDRIEIWDQRIYHQLFEDLADNAEAIAANITDLVRNKHEA